MTPPRQIVVGTAGHIDHGKSQLVRTLTGTDPDRLREEKERGITIDLGFASLTLGDGTRIGFVDVPGHERFVKNMLAGVGGIDLVLMVVAADESIKPQTREHFDICRLLRIARGLVVLTKMDLVEADILDLVRLEIRDFVAGSFLEDAPVIAVSSRTGEGMTELTTALQQASTEVPMREAGALMRLPVDRAFSIKGFGTVVTGTLLAGTIREGDEVVLQPHGVTARVRGLEVHNRPTPNALPGQRTAVNLQSIGVEAVARGDLLTVPGVLEPSHLLDVELECLGRAPAPIKDLARVRFHYGAAEVMARVKMLGGVAVPPGGQGCAQLRLERPVAALAGDRFILRRYSPVVTIGGGTVLHNRPPKLRGVSPDARERFAALSDPDPAVRLRVLVEEQRGAGIDLGALRARTGLDEQVCADRLEGAVRAGKVVALPTTPRRYISGAAHRHLVERILATLDQFHCGEPLREGMSREELRSRVFSSGHPDLFRCLLAQLADERQIRVVKDRIALASHRIDLDPAEATLLEQIEAAYAGAGTNPPSLKDIVAGLKADPRRAEKLFHLLLTRGRLVRIPDARVFHVSVLEGLKRRLWEKRALSQTIDISEFKDLSGTSRKNAIPLLEHFDQVHVTRREGNLRVILPPPDGASVDLP